MNGRRSKEIRKAAQDASQRTGMQAAGALEKVAQYTRGVEQRAEGLERTVGMLEAKALAWDAFRLRSFSLRLRWLFTGR